MSKPLEFNGERFTPECVREIWYEHFQRYAFAAELVKNKKVLDAACGEGYGSAHLALRAHSVSAVDVSDAAIRHARERYDSENLEFRVADCCALPFADDQFDCIVSFETLEHLEDQEGMLKEFRRVLEPGGVLLISSPDKAVYTDRYHNENEFHVRELYRHELENLLAAQFPACKILQQKLFFYSAIWSQEPDPGVVFQQFDDNDISTLGHPGHDGMYFIAVCAATEKDLPRLEPGLWLFDDQEESVYRHYNEEIRKHIAAGERIESLELEITQLRARLDEQAIPPPVTAPWWRRLFRSS